eukprot:1452754-Amphidinium_carterae.2
MCSKTFLDTFGGGVFVVGRQSCNCGCRVTSRLDCLIPKEIELQNRPPQQSPSQGTSTTITELIERQ